MHKYIWLPLLLLLLMFCLAVGPAAADSTCFQCHDKKEFAKRVTHKPLDNGECVSCHNPHAARYPGLLQRNGSKLCFYCHTALEKDLAKGFVHQPIKRGECLACHTPHASNSRGLLKGQGVDSCFSCHKNLPRQYRVVHRPFAQGDCSSCHEPHNADNPQLLKTTTSGSICSKCHSGADVNNGHKGFPKEANDCLSCHNPHGSNNKGLIRDFLHQPYAKGCKDCHKDGGARVTVQTCLSCHEQVIEQMLYQHSHLTDSSGNACVNCHSPHAGDTKSLLKGGQMQICRSCHPATFARMSESDFGHPDTVVCSNCHSAHGSDQLAMLKTGGIDTCSACHETQGVFTHPVGAKFKDPRTGQMITCVSCHYPHGTYFKDNLKDDPGKALCVQCHRDK